MSTFECDSFTCFLRNQKSQKLKQLLLYKEYLLHCDHAVLLDGFKILYLVSNKSECLYNPLNACATLT